MPTLRQLKGFSSRLLAVVGLAGCAMQTLAPGATEQEALASYGKPTAVVALPSGKRLQYSGQPARQAATMIDLDAAGRVTSVRQVLNANEFARVVVGSWTREDTLREFGRPAAMTRVGNWNGDIMAYRWQEANQPMLFYVYLDANQVVQQTGSGMELRRSRRF